MPEHVLLYSSNNTSYWSSPTFIVAGVLDAFISRAVHVWTCTSASLSAAVDIDTRESFICCFSSRYSVAVVCMRGAEAELNGNKRFSSCSARDTSSWCERWLRNSRHWNCPCWHISTLASTTLEIHYSSSSRVPVTQYSQSYCQWLQLENVFESSQILTE